LFFTISNHCLTISSGKPFLINISNHPSTRWSDEQKEASKEFASEIIDVPFPLVNPSANTAEICQLANDIFYKHIVPKRKNCILMIQGEFSLRYALFMLCKANGFSIAIPTTKREVQEKFLPDGSVIKQAVFKFIRWRIL